MSMSIEDDIFTFILTKNKGSNGSQEALSPDDPVLALSEVSFQKFTRPASR